MAIKWHPSTDRDSATKVVLSCDPSVEAVNAADTLQAYLMSGDESALEVPGDATRFSITPLSATQLLTAGMLFGGSAEEKADAVLRVCSWGLKGDSTRKSTPVVNGEWPRDDLDGYPVAALSELATHIQRVSQLTEGKDE